MGSGLVLGLTVSLDRSGTLPVANICDRCRDACNRVLQLCIALVVQLFAIVVSNHTVIGDGHVGEKERIVDNRRS